MSDDAQDPFLHDPQAFGQMIDLERQLAELAAYHVGLFTGAASRIDSSPAAIAHGLSLLIEEAKQRRLDYRA
jgi:hypothetical protein